MGEDSLFVSQTMAPLIAIPHRYSLSLPVSFEASPKERKEEKYRRDSKKEKEKERVG